MKNKHLLFTALFFTIISSANLPSSNTTAKKIPLLPSVSYLDQVVKRKKNLILKKCPKPTSQTQGFMMIELKVFNSGKTKARMTATDLTNKNFLKCALSVLNRTRFKKFKNASVTRIYPFFVL